MSSSGAGQTHMTEAQLPAMENRAPGEADRYVLPSLLLHDLRTPLNQTIGYAEMLEAQAQEEGRDDFVPDLRQGGVAGRQLLALINDSFLPLRTPSQDVAPTISAAAPVAPATPPTSAPPSVPQPYVPQQPVSETVAQDLSRRAQDVVAEMKSAASSLRQG